MIYILIIFQKQIFAHIQLLNLKRRKLTHMKFWDFSEQLSYYAEELSKFLKMISQNLMNALGSKK